MNVWTTTPPPVDAAHPRAASHALALVPEISAALGQALDTFRLNVTKLKVLGLTEKRKVGGKLSPRGRALLLRTSP